jgi:hypothetical protein
MSEGPRFFRLTLGTSAAALRRALAQGRGRGQRRRAPAVATRQKRERGADGPGYRVGREAVVACPIRVESPCVPSLARPRASRAPRKGRFRRGASAIEASASDASLPASTTRPQAGPASGTGRRPDGAATHRRRTYKGGSGRAAAAQVPAYANPSRTGRHGRRKGRGRRPTMPRPDRARRQRVLRGSDAARRPSGSTAWVQLSAPPRSRCVRKFA